MRSGGRPPTVQLRSSSAAATSSRWPATTPASMSASFAPIAPYLRATRSVFATRTMTALACEIHSWPGFIAAIRCSIAPRDTGTSPVA